MFHPDILAALAKERRVAMLAEAAAARLATQTRETRRRRRVPGSSGVRWVVPVAGQLRDVCARLVRRRSGTVEREITLVASEDHERDRGALSPR